MIAHSFFDRLPQHSQVWQLTTEEVVFQDPPNGKIQWCQIRGTMLAIQHILGGQSNGGKEIEKLAYCIRIMRQCIVLLQSQQLPSKKGIIIQFFAQLQQQVEILLPYVGTVKKVWSKQAMDTDALPPSTMELVDCY